MQKTVEQFLDNLKESLRSDPLYPLEIPAQIIQDVSLTDLEDIISYYLKQRKANTAQFISIQIKINFPGSFSPEQQLPIYQKLLNHPDINLLSFYFTGVYFNQSTIKAFKSIIEKSQSKYLLANLSIELSPQFDKSDKEEFLHYLESLYPSKKTKNSDVSKKIIFENDLKIHYQSYLETKEEITEDPQQAFDKFQIILDKLGRYSPFLKNLIDIEMINILINAGNFLLAYQFAENIADKHIKRIFQAEIINLDNTLVESGLLTLKEKITVITYLTVSANPMTSNSTNAFRHNLLKNYFEAFQSNRDVVRPSNQSFFEKTGYELAISSEDFYTLLTSNNIPLPAQLTFGWFLEQLNLPDVKKDCREYFGTDKLVPLEILMHLPTIKNDSSETILIQKEIEQLSIENKILPRIAGFYLTDKSKQELDRIASHPSPQKTFDSEEIYMGAKAAADQLHVPEAYEILAEFYQTIGEEKLASDYKKAFFYYHGLYLTAEGIRLAKENNEVALKGLEDGMDENYENALFLALLYQVGTSSDSYKENDLYDLTNNQVKRNKKMSSYYYHKILELPSWKEALQQIFKNIDSGQLVQWKPFLLVAYEHLRVSGKNHSYKNKICFYFALDELRDVKNSNYIFTNILKTLLESDPLLLSKSDFKKIITSVTKVINYRLSKNLSNYRDIPELLLPICNIYLQKIFKQWSSKKKDRPALIEDFLKSMDFFGKIDFKNEVIKLIEKNMIQSIFTHCKTKTDQYYMFHLLNSFIQNQELAFNFLMLTTNYFIQNNIPHIQFFEEIFFNKKYFKNSTMQDIFFKNILFFVGEPALERAALNAIHFLNEDRQLKDIIYCYKVLAYSSQDKRVKTIATRRHQIFSEETQNSDQHKFEKLWNDARKLNLADRVSYLFYHYNNHSTFTLFKSHVSQIFKSEDINQHFSNVAEDIVKTLDANKHWQKEDILNYFASEKLTDAIINAKPNCRIINMIKFVECICLNMHMPREFSFERIISHIPKK